MNIPAICLYAHFILLNTIRPYSRVPQAQSYQHGAAVRLVTYGETKKDVSVDEPTTGTLSFTNNKVWWEEGAIMVLRPRESECGLLIC